SAEVTQSIARVVTGAQAADPFEQDHRLGREQEITAASGGSVRYSGDAVPRRLEVVGDESVDLSGCQVSDVVGLVQAMIGISFATCHQGRGLVLHGSNC